MNREHASRVSTAQLTIAGQFAPPMSFAPPSTLNDEPPPPPADLPDDPTGEDAYARRMRLSQVPPPPPPPPPVNNLYDITGVNAPAGRMQLVGNPPPPPLEPSTEQGQIARAPIRYSLPKAPPELPASETELDEKLQENDGEEQRSSKPGQAGFAERLMAKYGWSKGQGLGAKGTGIVNPLYAKADVRKKKSDADGGGFATAAGTGKILGGRKAKGATEEEQGKFGPMSEVIRLENMLDGMDIDEELSRGEGGIMQEIGEECGDKYGTVERVYIHRRSKSGGPMVFVCFVSQLSALRAVNALDGRVFGGNAIAARFWDKERFSRDDFE
jgi:splicing factor 45